MIALPSSWAASGEVPAKEQFANVHYLSRCLTEEISIVSQIEVNKARRIRLVVLIAMLVGVAFMLIGRRVLPPRTVSFSQSLHDLAAYDFVEVTAQISAPHPPNPFTDAAIRGTFQMEAGNKRWQVEGFCDADDGSVYRIRFMPVAPGDYTYSVEYRQAWSTATTTGTFHVRNGGRREFPRLKRQCAARRHHRVLADGLAG